MRSSERVALYLRRERAWSIRELRAPVVNTDLETTMLENAARAELVKTPLCWLSGPWAARLRLDAAEFPDHVPSWVPVPSVTPTYSLHRRVTPRSE